ncbi:hypothetical protein NQ315_008042 [Exocentrus adspersus]|uniref:Uncharacterized protein n=1 Tax=Exocentrus adspersus TaxID=1586481 RepID=A0AAV8VVR5_9CUCU|nr:hypothetical protein NQ315_008042 [Exocentrus adspersus]
MAVAVNYERVLRNLVTKLDQDVIDDMTKMMIVITTVISVEPKWCNAMNEAHEQSYSFNYTIDVEGVLSQHYESRQINLTKGSYSFLQPDGQIRIVQYQVNASGGFRAILKYRKLSDQSVGHLRYPKDFSHPVVLAVPVSLITSDLFKVRSSHSRLFI